MHRGFMNINETLTAIKELKPRYHYDIEIDNPTIEETEAFLVCAKNKALFLNGLMQTLSA